MKALRTVGAVLHSAADAQDLEADIEAWLSQVQRLERLAVNPCFRAMIRIMDMRIARNLHAMKRTVSSVTGRQRIQKWCRQYTSPGIASNGRNGEKL